MNKELITLDKNNTITVTALRENSARCGWSICVFTAVGSLRTMHIHDGDAFIKFIDAAALLAGLEELEPTFNRASDNRMKLVAAIHAVTDNSLFSIAGMRDVMDHLTSAHCGYGFSSLFKLEGAPVSTEGCVPACKDKCDT